jgi:hypothetical protein
MITDGLIEDGFFLLLLFAILALFWFRPWRWHRMRLLKQARTKAEPNRSLDARKKVA